MKNQKYKSFNDLPLMLTVMDLAEVLGISRTGAYELVRQEGFPALNIGKRIVILPRNQKVPISCRNRHLS